MMRITRGVDNEATNALGSWIAMTLLLSSAYNQDKREVNEGAVSHNKDR